MNKLCMAVGIMMVLVGVAQAIPYSEFQINITAIREVPIYGDIIPGKNDTLGKTIYGVVGYKNESYESWAGMKNTEVSPGECRKIIHTTKAGIRYGKATPIDVIPKMDISGILSAKSNDNVFGKLLSVEEDIDKMTMTYEICNPYPAKISPKLSAEYVTSEAEKEKLGDSDSILKKEWSWYNITWNCRKTFQINNTTDGVLASGSVIEIYNESHNLENATTESRLVFNNTDSIDFYTDGDVLQFPLSKSLGINVTHNYTLYWCNSSVVAEHPHNTRFSGVELGSYYAFEDNITDSVGNFDLSFTGSGYAYTSNSMRGKALNFTDTTFTIAHHATAHAFTTPNFSVNVWVNPSTSVYDEILTKCSHADAKNIFAFRQFTSPSRYNMDITNSSNQGASWIDTTGFSVGKWAMLTIVATPGRAFFYVNGTEVGNATLKAMYVSGNLPFRIGGPSHLTSRNWQGAVDEVAIFNSSLPASMVSQLYNSGSGLTYSDTANLGFASGFTILEGGIEYETDEIHVIINYPYNESFSQYGRDVAFRYTPVSPVGILNCTMSFSTANFTNDSRLYSGVAHEETLSLSSSYNSTWVNYSVICFNTYGYSVTNTTTFMATMFPLPTATFEYNILGDYGEQPSIYYCMNETTLYQSWSIWLDSYPSVKEKVIHCQYGCNDNQCNTDSNIMLYVMLILGLIVILAVFRYLLPMM